MESLPAANGPRRGLARRAFLRTTVGAGGVALVSLLAACGTATTATTATTSAASSAAATTAAATSQAATTSAAATTSSAAATTTSKAATTTAASTSSAAASSSAAAAATGMTRMADADTLRVNILGEADKIDPNLAEFTNEIAVVRQVFDTLVLLDKDLKPIPGAAESWTTSADGLTWTFKIRGHKYSDGTPVKAQDFAFSFKRILDPTVAAPYASYFAGIIKGSAAYNNAVVAAPVATSSTASTSAPAAKPTVTPDELKKLADAVGVKAVDDSTLAITLEQPTPYFVDVVSLAVVPPLRQELVSAGWTNDPKKYIGNGPFGLIEHQPQDHYLFGPNPNYWGGPPKIGLLYREIQSTPSAEAAYRNNELDINIPSPNSVPGILADATLAKEFQKAPTLLMIWWLHDVKHPPLSNKQFRQALSQGVDRDAFVKDQLKGLGLPAVYFIPQGMPGYDANQGADYKFDLTKAKASLKASGVDPATTKLTLLFRSDPTNQQHWAYLQAQLKQNLGVNLVLDGQEAKARVAAQKAHKFDMVATGWSADYPDPQDWYDIFLTGGGNNNGEYSNPDYDKLVKQADVEADGNKRASLYAQAAKILLDDQPFLLMYQSVQFATIKPWVQNFQYTAQDEFPGDYFYKNITLAKH